VRQAEEAGSRKAVGLGRCVREKRAGVARAWREVRAVDGRVGAGAGGRRAEVQG